MKRLIILSVMFSLFGFGESNGQENEKLSTKEGVLKEDKNGVIGTYYEGDYPIVMKFINEFPEKEKIERLPFLTVISWSYDGSNNNGMPAEHINKRMITLEDAVEKSMSSTDIFTHVYSRTGNNLKEFVYYCNKQPEFMTMLNNSLEGHDTYPIEITFYPDKEWSDFKKTMDIFKEKE